MDSNQILFTPVKTIKYASWMDQKRRKQIQDGGRPTSSKKYIKIAISQQLFDRFWRNLTGRCMSDVQMLSAVKISGI